ncbi:MAG: 16S rRNA (cytosine(967)-C(5))-methyltransferase RsmB [Clostridia bacterium]|nr:16S rRNA (cytosine(967)-C(5))-methyltransferase RsmB [Clostridia bacterium]
MNNARYAAAISLKKVTDEGGYSNLVLNNTLEQHNLSSEDKALCTAIFYGTLDRMVTIDFYLKKLIKTPLKKVIPFTLAVLRTAVYQIKYMDKIPNSAAVDEAVKLIKTSSESFNASFVNAVLRNFLREEIPLPTGNSLYDISVAYSCPAWIVSILIRDYGVEFTKNFLSASLLPPPIFIRVNTLKTTAEKLSLELKEQGILVKQTSSKNALELNSAGSLESISVYKEGLFFVQDISCQKAIEALDININSRVLDLCAAPGGKSFSAAMSAEKGEIVSCDLYPQRVGLIREGAERLGIQNLKATTADASEYNYTLGKFDRIICDVPCSGLGVIRRKPDIKYKPQDSFEELISLQRQILENACHYLGKGGKILYSTCTLNKAENRENVDAFLKEHKDFSLIFEETFYPKTDNADGFYAAVMKKE